MNVKPANNTKINSNNITLSLINKFDSNEISLLLNEQPLVNNEDITELFSDEGRIPYFLIIQAL